MKIRVDSDVCVGHGRCQLFAPEVFGENERGHCLILLEDVPPELQDAARLGADSCPEKAITILDDE